MNQADVIRKVRALLNVQVGRGATEAEAADDDGKRAATTVLLPEEY